MTLLKIILEDYRSAKDYLIYFNQSRDKLLSLINYNSNQQLEDVGVKLFPPDQYLTKLPAINSSLLNLDTIALFYRPELTQALYKINETEKQKYLVVLERLPSLGFNLGYNYDSDKFLLHQNWWSDNISLAWNLLNLATIPGALDTTETQIEAAKLTHLASSAVVLGEIRVLLYNYKMKKYDYTLAEQESVYSNDIYQHSLNNFAANLSEKQVLLTDKLVAMNAELTRLRAFVDTRNLLEDIIMSLGLYHTEGDLVKKDYVDTAIINKWINKFNEHEFDKLISAEYKNLKLADAGEVHEKPASH